MPLRIPTLVGLWLAAVCAQLSAAEFSLGRPTAALMPLQNQAGHLSAGQALHQGVERELVLQLNLASAEDVRNVMRSLRIRSTADLSADRLRRVRPALQTDWLVFITLHDVSLRIVPALTASAQVYRADTGELHWSGLVARSGLNGLPWLGLGVTYDIPDLAGEVALQLAADIAGAVSSPALASSQQAFADGRKWALVPLAGLTRKQGTANAATVTEAVRDVSQQLGLQLVSPNVISEILRRQGVLRWGEVTRELRVELASERAVAAILTGAVEIYEVTGSATAPQPRVEISLRLVDAATGNILWSGAIERSGSHRKGPFGAGRVHSRGELAQRVTRELLSNLQRSEAF